MGETKVRSRNGIHIETDNKVVADGIGDKNSVSFVSHAHADHAIKGKDIEAVCSEKTLKLVNKRFGNSADMIRPDNIELRPSGHIVGSTSALIDDKVLYTGDVSTQDRLYMKGFEPVDAETLIIESTYGVPSYRLPEQRKVVNEIKDWIEDNEKETVFLFGYSLGKAQKIQQIVQEVSDKPVFGHNAVIEMNNAVQDVTDLNFRAEPYVDNKDRLDEGIVIAPSRCSQADWIQKQVERNNGIKAGFSGWALNNSFKYRGGYDKTFPLSDHCGFDDLVKIVKEVDPDRVYTHHGFDEAFASYLKKELGYNARALKNNQSSLEKFYN